ncbi:hypothetical protein OF83DRAFT_1140321 [Amylostereum chailletii]|nr:hypothetical protein OF83DRAFT_1140321 [Amylostereum chailletii]
MSTETAQTPEHPAITPAEPPFNRSDADVVLISSDNVHFRAHKIILAIASPIFDTMFSLPQPSNAPDGGGLPTVTMSEDARTLYIVLRTCYPVNSPKVLFLEDITIALEMSQKYEIAPLKGIAEDGLLNTVELNPISVFAIACHYGLGDVATRAAEASLKVPLSSMQSSHLLLITGDKFNQLLQYHLQCGRAASRVPGQRQSWATQNTTAVNYSTANPCSTCCISDTQKPPVTAFNGPIVIGTAFRTPVSQQIQGLPWWAPSSVWDGIAATQSNLLVHPYYYSTTQLLAFVFQSNPPQPHSVACLACSRSPEMYKEIYTAISAAIASAAKQVAVPAFVKPW